MASVTQLGYVGLEASDPAAWERFACDVLGCELADRRPDGTLAFRIDDHAERIFVHPGPADDLGYAGWEVASAAELDALAGVLGEAGADVGAATPVETALRGVDRLLVSADPAGNRVELYCGPALAGRSFRSPHVAAGFVAGAVGLGHVVLSMPSLRAGEDFYGRLLGLRPSDRVGMQLPAGPAVEIAFLRANARHHSLALVELPLPKRIHHLMLEVSSFDDVGRAHDRWVDSGLPVTRGLGRHSNDRMVSFYGLTPSGFEIEYGCDGLSVDDSSWRVRRYDRMSDWGHRPPA